MKGGSIASDAVQSLVDQPTYDALSKAFTNEFTAPQKGGKKGTRAKKGGCARCGKTGVPHACKQGGSSMLGTTSEAFANFANTAAPYNSLLPGNVTAIAAGILPNASKNAATKASNASKTNTKAANTSKLATTNNAAKNTNTAKNVSNSKTTTQIAGFARNLTQLMNANSAKNSSYSLMNRKRGGTATPTTIPIGPRLDINALSGVPLRTNAPTTAQNVLAHETVPSLDMLDKSVRYGPASDIPVAPFSFGQQFTNPSGGAWSKKPTKKATPKKVAPKKK